ncbi:MAG: inosine/xanthosine triphosphatase [Candidatus Micrarchaeia archaeon]|jgi:inosine/xanthosine triphosphatase
MAGKGHCIIGGTFTYVHAGHARLLVECNEFSRITIGLTSDKYVRAHKIYPSFPYEKRLANLKRNLAHNGLLSRAAIVKIESESDVADRLAADAIIVSGETEAAAEKINAARKRRGIPALKIISVPLAYADNLQKISCADIFHGKYDVRGKLLRPLRVQAGTDNPTKLTGARTALARVFGRKFALSGHKEKSLVSHHPFNAETFRGAENRARAAWKRAKGKCDYSLGIESGLFEIRKGEFFDITICCVFDGKAATFGTGAGFCVPAWMARKIRGKSDLSRVMEKLAGVEGIGRRQGALGWFSGGVMHRADQVEQAVANALVPRIAMARKGIRY